MRFILIIGFIISSISFLFSQNQAERIQRMFQETILVDDSKVALSLRFNDVHKISDDKLQDYIEDGVNWAYSSDHLESKIRKAYPSFIEGTVVFRNTFNPKPGEAVVFINLDSYGPNIPFLFKDVNNKHVIYEAIVEITIERD